MAKTKEVKQNSVHGSAPCSCGTGKRADSCCGVPIPDIGTSGNLNLSGALAEKEYLQEHPRPEHGWTPSVAIQIEQRITSLNAMIADGVLRERTAE